MTVCVCDPTPAPSSSREQEHFRQPAVPEHGRAKWPKWQVSAHLRDVSRSLSLALSSGILRKLIVCKLKSLDKRFLCAIIDTLYL